MDIGIDYTNNIIPIFNSIFAWPIFAQMFSTYGAIVLVSFVGGIIIAFFMRLKG